MLRLCLFVLFVFAVVFILRVCLIAVVVNCVFCCLFTLRLYFIGMIVLGCVVSARRRFVCVFDNRFWGVLCWLKWLRVLVYVIIMCLVRDCCCVLCCTFVSRYIYIYIYLYLCC